MDIEFDIDFAVLAAELGLDRDSESMNASQTSFAVPSQTSLSKPKGYVSGFNFFALQIRQKRAEEFKVCEIFCIYLY
jgi:hypothetical protein